MESGSYGHWLRPSFVPNNLIMTVPIVAPIRNSLSLLDLKIRLQYFIKVCMRQEVGL